MILNPNSICNSFFIFFISFSIHSASLAPPPSPVVNSILFIGLQQLMKVLSHDLLLYFQNNLFLLNFISDILTIAFYFMHFL
jgi:hypothetical protein